nr:biotin/lipoyl-containing protein [Aliamphritea spongicola]
MKYFKLPDLGEGLPEAEILEWLIQEGDTVKTDQVLVSVETAKAIIEIPSLRTVPSPICLVPPATLSIPGNP